MDIKLFGKIHIFIICLFFACSSKTMAQNIVNIVLRIDLENFSDSVNIVLYNNSPKIILSLSDFQIKTECHFIKDSVIYYKRLSKQIKIKEGKYDLLIQDAPSKKSVIFKDVIIDKYGAAVFVCDLKKIEYDNFSDIFKYNKLAIQGHFKFGL
jgi:hypothetical protein